MKTTILIINLFLFGFFSWLVHAQPIMGIDHGESQEAGGCYSSSGGAYRTPNKAKTNLFYNLNASLQGVSAPLLTGKGVTIFLFDYNRPMNSHKAFDHRVFVNWQDVSYYDPSIPGYTGKLGIPECENHPTMASGIMVSSLAEAKGIAPDANIIAYGWDFPYKYLKENADKGANLACVPYGYVAGWIKLSSGWRWFGKKGENESYLFGLYSDISQKWDNVIHLAPYLLVVKSTGNDNNEGPAPGDPGPFYVWDGSNLSPLASTDVMPETDGFNGTSTLSDIAVSKNVLTVGGVYNNGNILQISSRGPTDDFRIKPDLVANGDNRNTTVSGDAIGQSGIGTSFAVAELAGNVALLLEQQANLYGKTKLLSSTLKGLLIHTADDKGMTGPDCTYGWGLVNINNASKLISDNFINHRQIHEFTFTADDQVVVFKVKKNNIPTDTLKVTICWNDPAGPLPPVSLNPTERTLVNDIDLRVIRKDNKEMHYPWKLNPANPAGKAITGDNSVDNVEQVKLNDNLEADYYIKISPKGHLSEKQVVSVIISGIDANAFQSDVTLPNSSITDTLAEESQHTITCNSVNVMQKGGLSLVARNNILLKTGFKVQAGAMFKAVLDSNFFSVFEHEYPSVVFRNDSVWASRSCGALKNGETNKNDTTDVLKILNNQPIVFPNPSNGRFTIMLSDHMDTQAVEISDVWGRVCYRRNCCFQVQENIDLTNYPDGLYLIKVQSGNKAFVIKQIKKKP